MTHATDDRQAELIKMAVKFVVKLNKSNISGSERESLKSEFATFFEAVLASHGMYFEIMENAIADLSLDTTHTLYEIECLARENRLGGI